MANGMRNVSGTPLTAEEIEYVKEEIRRIQADENVFIDSLPYKLTDAQARAAGEICRDIASDMAMNRLLQGDVGSGKTVVAEHAPYLRARRTSQQGFQRKLRHENHAAYRADQQHRQPGRHAGKQNEQKHDENAAQTQEHF